MAHAAMSVIVAHGAGTSEHVQYPPAQVTLSVRSPRALIHAASSDVYESKDQRASEHVQPSKLRRLQACTLKLPFRTPDL